MAVNYKQGETKKSKLTKISQIGISKSNAKGSKLLSTSFGTPCVLIVAACEVKLLVNWLYGNQ